MKDDVSFLLKAYAWPPTTLPEPIVKIQAWRHSVFLNWLATTRQLCQRITDLSEEWGVYKLNKWEQGAGSAQLIDVVPHVLSMLLTV